MGIRYPPMGQTTQELSKANARTLTDDELGQRLAAVYAVMNGDGATWLSMEDIKAAIYEAAQRLRGGDS